MGAAHNIAKKIFQSPEAKDPGASGTVTADRSPHVVGLISAAAESRTLARPTRVGGLCLLWMKTDGGDITLTVTGGYNEDGDTTFTFDDPGEFIFLVSCHDGTNYFWRKLADHATAVLTQTEAGYLEDVTAGTGAASKAVVLSSGGDFAMPSGGVFALDRAALAAAGTGQSDAAAVATQVVVVTGADDAKGVALPAAATTEGPIFLVNDAARRLLVYPVNGGNDAINGLTAGTGVFTLEGGEWAVFVPTSATQWYTATRGAMAKPTPMTRSTIANAGTVSAAQLRGRVLYQDASGGNVTMTTRTGTQIAGDQPEMRVGDAVQIFVASNHASNTSTISGGTDVTLVGSGAVTQTGGTFLLIKTAATTFDLVRVG